MADKVLAALQKATKNLLYPSETGAGRELRLVQEYFLVACAVRDIVRRYQQDHATFDRFADKVAVQLNDTHPTLAIVESIKRPALKAGVTMVKVGISAAAKLRCYPNHVTLMQSA